jgi:soluble lytic murein transglycosylase-like protein
MIVAVAMMLTLSTTVHAAEIPADIKEAAEEYGEAYCISPALIEAICYEESRFTPDIINKSGKNYGLMQVSPYFNRDRMERLGIAKADLLTVRGNILVGTDLLAELFEEHEDVILVLLIYGGFSKAKINAYLTKGSIPGYIERLLDRANKYEQANEKGGEQ